MNVNTVGAQPTIVGTLEVPGGVPLGIPLGLDPLMAGVDPNLDREVDMEEENQGAEVEQGDTNGSAFSYDEVFPALPEAEAQEAQNSNPLGQWSQRMKVKTSEITQVFRVPVEERKYPENCGGSGNSSFGVQGQQARICAEIMSKTGANIEISSSKDQSLTIVVTGKEDAVAKARKEIVAQLQTQASASILIPKEHFRFILGKSAKKLIDLELATATKIHIPRPGDNSDYIDIRGTKEGIEKARHEIQLISDEQAKLALERLDIPKVYHPFIFGPFGNFQIQLMNETGARINIPPPSVMKDEITVSGEKEAVAKAKERILAIYEDKKRNCQTVSVEVKKEQHKYIIGPKGSTLHEILEKTGVSVEMPPAESNLGTITLRGEQEKLGPALTLLYDKANSSKVEKVNAPSWLHKFIIGKKGAVIKQIVQDFPSVHVEFTDGEDSIKVEGPHEEVNKACEKLESMARDLMSKYHFDTIAVDPKYHRHIIGKNGANVNRLKLELGVQIQIPPDSEKCSVIRIEGTPQGVEQAKKELLDMVNKMENEVTREIPIEQRFHKTIIGAKGGKIKEIRDKYNQVSITFPEAGVKSEKVTIRGPKQDVDKCYKELADLNKDLVINNFKAEVPIYKQFHKFVIGKGGANIKKIRDETDTRIDLPAEGADSDVIVITGKRDNVLAAKDKITEIQNTLSNIVSVDIIIPARFHNSIIGAKGRLIRSIKEECGGVTIHFPPEGSGSDKVSIRGPKEDVDKAKKQLIELSNEKQQSGYTEELKARREHHKFLIGKNGANIKKVRDRTGARIIFPSEKDDDQDSIIIIGHKESVLLAKKELSDMIKELDHLVELEMRVEPKHHRHFVARRGQILRQIEEDYGGVTVSFPRNGVNSDIVILKGAKECVAGAKNKILEIVADLDSRVVVECVISQQYHRTVMGSRGHKVQNISQEFDVHIKFPERDTRADFGENGDDVQSQQVVNGEEGEVDQRRIDTILITGQKDKCQAAMEALLALVPTTIEVTVPYDLHRYVIGKKGQGVREMMDTYDVNISVPQANEQCDIIKISGPPANVESARENLLSKVRQFELDKQDRVLRSFQLSVEVDPKYHPKIIGKGGGVIKKIRSDYDVFIQFNERNHPEEHIITIIGYEKKAEAARDRILKMVKEMEDVYEQAIQLDPRVHSRLIGSRGRNIRRIMEEHQVEIKFPRGSDDDDTVIVSGEPERVDEAIDKLRNLEEEYLQDLDVTGQVHSSRDNAGENENRPQDTHGFVVTGGPWEHNRVPDTSSTMEFPSFGSADVPKPVAWGPRQ